MLCCLLAALLAGPVGLWAVPRPNPSGGRGCCVDRRRGVLILSTMALALIAACTVVFLQEWIQPAPFRHICSTFARL
jgi:hypothetical protein